MPDVWGRPGGLIFKGRHIFLDILTLEGETTGLSQGVRHQLHLIQKTLLLFVTDVASYKTKIIYRRNYTRKDATDKCFDYTSVTDWTVDNLPGMPPTALFRHIHF